DRSSQEIRGIGGLTVFAPTAVLLRMLKEACSGDLPSCRAPISVNNGGDVSPSEPTDQRWQRASLLEHCRKSSNRGRPGGAAAGAVPGRDQRQPESQLV